MHYQSAWDVTENVNRLFNVKSLKKKKKRLTINVQMMICDTIIHQWIE